MALIPEDDVITPTPTSQEAFWALQDEYAAFFVEADAIEARHQDDWDRHNDRYTAWLGRFSGFNQAHTGQTFQLYRPGQGPTATAEEWQLGFPTRPIHP